MYMSKVQSNKKQTWVWSSLNYRHWEWPHAFRGSGAFPSRRIAAHCSIFLRYAVTRSLHFPIPSYTIIYIYRGIIIIIIIIENSQFTIFGFPVPSFSLCQDDFPGTLFISSVVMKHLVGVRSWIPSGHELIHAVYECGIMRIANSCMPNRAIGLALPSIDSTHL